MSNSREFTSNSLEDTTDFAKKFVDGIESKESGATIVCLYGDLGSGKTTFVKAVAKFFGIKEIVTSPTFVIEKIYDIDFKNFKKLIHIDAYRLKEGAELLALGWEEITSKKENIIFIEWPKYVADVLPENRHNLSFTFVDDKTRTIDVS